MSSIGSLPTARPKCGSARRRSDPCIDLTPHLVRGVSPLRSQDPSPFGLWKFLVNICLLLQSEN